jgi:hypothetical protein
MVKVTILLEKKKKQKKLNLTIVAKIATLLEMALGNLIWAS